MVVLPHLGRIAAIAALLLIFEYGLLAGSLISPWRIWTSADGMPESYCTSLSQDAAGNLIIRHGDVTRISILNGYQVSTVSDSHSFGRVFGDSTGKLWTFGAEGIRIYDGSRWKSFPVREIPEFAQRHPFPVNWIFYTAAWGQLQKSRMDMIPLRAGGAVSGAFVSAILMFPDRLVEWSLATHSTTVIRTARQTRLTSFRDLQPASDGGLWVGGERGLGHLKKTPSGFEWSDLPGPQGLTDVLSPMEGRKGDVILSALRANGNRALIKVSDEKWSEIPTSDIAHGNFAGKAPGDLPTLKGWRGPDDEQWMEHESTVYTKDNPDILRDMERGDGPAGSIIDVLSQKDGAFWVATSQGLARYSPALWRTPSGARGANRLVNSIVEDSAGRIWYLMDGYLIVNDGDHWVRFALPPGQRQVSTDTDSLHILGNGDIALRVNSDASFLVFEKKTRAFRKVDLPKGSVMGRILNRPQGGIWLQIFDHGNREWQLLAWDGKRFLYAGQPRRFSSSNMKVMLESRNGDVWLGGTSSLILIRSGQSHVQGSAEGFTDTGVFSALELPDGHILLGGRNNVTEYDGKKFHVIQSGMDRVWTIRAGRDGWTWIASGAGIYRYRSGQWITNTVEDGLPSSAAYNVFCDRTGRVWAGTLRGLSLLHPEADTDPPLTKISEDKNLLETPPSGEVRLVFGGIDKWQYTAPERLKFSSRIDKSSWSSFESGQVRSFKNLASGAHDFEVRAMDRNGNIDPHGAEFRFAVLLPWYRQSFFLVLISLAALAIGVLSRLTRTHHQRLIFQGTHDSLTQLANRGAADASLDQALVKARKEGTCVAVIAIDLDRFKPINDKLGHEFGDRFLQEIGRRLRSCVRKQDTLARVGGDEFTIIMPDLNSLAEAEAVAARIVSSFARPCQIEAHELVSSASIGISFYPDHGRDAACLRRAADIAMYHGKAMRMDQYVVFSAQLPQLDQALTSSLC
ncbi:MAG: diguanylate cyclase [Terriglobia bacterium]